MIFSLKAGTLRDWTNEHPAPSHHACSVGRYAEFALSSGSVSSPVPHHPLLNPAVRRQWLPPSCDCLSHLLSLSLEYFTNIDRDTFRKRYLLPHSFSGWELKLQHCQRCAQMCGVPLEANLAWIWRNYICWKSSIAQIYSTLCTLKSITTAIHYGQEFLNWLLNFCALLPAVHNVIPRRD